MKLRIKRVASVALAIFLVVSVVGAPVGTAAANHKQECNPLDDVISWAMYGLAESGECVHAIYTHDTVQEMEQSDANQTKVDLYSAASGSKAGREAWAAPYDNYLNDTESVAWMKAQVAIAEAYQNGSTKPEAKVAAKEAIAEYYATKQVNLVEQWNVSVSEFATLQGIAKNETGIQGDDETDAFLHETTRNNGDHADLKVHHVGHTNSTTVQLVNATNVGSKALEIGYKPSHVGSDTVLFDVQTGAATVSYDTDSWTIEGLAVDAPNTNYDPFTYMMFPKFKNRWTEIENQNTQLQSESENFVNATWSDYDSGQINASDVISSNTAMFEYGTRSASENDSLYNSVGALAVMGFDTPNVSDSGVMTVVHEGSIYEGIVMAESAPNGTWTVGQTYNTSNITGPVFMATTDGHKVEFVEGTEFTIDSMTAKDGSSMDSIETTRYSYKTANTSELLAMQDQLSALRSEIEARQQTIAPGGGGGGLPDVENSTVILLAVGAAGAYLLFGRDGG